MIAPAITFFMADMMSLPNAGCKDRRDIPARPVAVNLNP
jgi:hypothetical protein